MNCLPTPPPDPLLINIKIEQYGSFCMILNNTTNYGPYNSKVSHIKHSRDYGVLSQELSAYMIKDSYVSPLLYCSYSVYMDEKTL